MPWNLTGNAKTHPNKNFLGTTDKEPLVLRTDGKEAARIDAAGQVGIGTKSPAARLEITADWNGSDGAMRLSGDKPTMRLTAGPVAGNQSWLLHVGSDGPGSLQIFKQGAAAGAWDNVTTFAPNGRVGIGTNDPSGRANGQLVVVAQVDAATAAVVGVSDSGNVDIAGNGGWFESSQGEGVRGWSKNINHGGVVGVNTGGGTAVFGTSDDGTGVWGTSRQHEGVHGESNALSWAAGVTGVARNAEGVGPGVLGQSAGSGPGVFGQSNKDGGVVGFHGDPRLQETTVGSEGAKAGVFGASDLGAGVLGYTRNNASAAVIAFGGLRSSAMNYPYAGEFFGNVQVNGDIFLPGADCAEQFDFAAVAEVTPGDVVVISEDGLLQLSREAYDRKVAGVISGAGSFRPGIILDRKEPQVDRLPVALMGKVFCKVDAGYGAIGVGDLLTTSHTPGHAMKAADALKSFGAVIGKALAACPAGTGLIPILVALN